ncbi:MAG: GNAT family N-acetyltransferase [Chloroflexi bacterium]|nr:GNAT family N-acetyltransferase [Chloroflexota bacterium]
MPTPIIDIPQTLESERLLMRLPEVNDVQQFHEAVVESLNELRPWFRWAARPISLDVTQGFLEHAREAFLAQQEMNWLVFLKGTDAFIGSVAQHELDWSVPKCSISYWIRTSRTGHGYMTEAVRRVVEFAVLIEGMRRVEVSCDLRNTRSAALARHLGFDYEGTLRCDSRDPVTGESVDMMFFAKVARS